MPATARVTDMFQGTCSCHPPAPPIPMSGLIITGSGNVITNNLKTARKTDIGIGFCGHVTAIKSGSPDVIVNNLDMARVDDPVDG